MAKKFGKVLLFAAAIGSAAAAVCYFVRKKNVEHEGAEEEDYDDFSDDSQKDSDASRSYVPLNTDTPAQEENEAPKEQEAPAQEDSSFTPLSEKVEEAAKKAEETVEEFFDEEDGSDEEPPLGND